MPLELAFQCPLPNGLHARPASRLAELTEPFASEIILINERTGLSASARSVLEMVGTDILFNDPCRIQIAGPDEDRAYAALTDFIGRTLPKIDQPLPKVDTDILLRPLPRMLQSAAPHCLRATPVSPGIARGAVVFARALTMPKSVEAGNVSDPAGEIRKIADAFSASRAAIETKLAAASPTEAEVLKAHLSIVKDPALSRKMVELAQAGRSAGQVIVEAGQAFAARLRDSENAYLRERVMDVYDVCQQLLQDIYGPEIAQAERVELSGPSVIVADLLTPRQFLDLDRTHLRALVLGHAGTTSHTILLARSFGIPVLAGLPDAPARLSPGQEVIVDGDLGLLIIQQNDAIRRYYELEDRKAQAIAQRLRTIAAAPATTADGKTLSIAANVSSHEEVGPAMDRGAQGVGLFRTEILFLSAQSLPSEEEQFRLYADAVRNARGLPVTFRTLDIGGDKPLPSLAMPAEDNPFLGVRGIRVSMKHPDLFDAQIRAILRASSLGPVKIMLPMVATLDEVRWAKARIAELSSQIGVQVPLGIMVEVPSVAFAIEQFSKELDFFSIGTNDLAQYFFAAGRDNPAVSGLCNPLHPSFLQLLKQIVDEVHRHGRTVSMCGDMARDPLHLPLLVALGLDEISVPSADIPAIKSTLAGLSSADCEKTFASALSCEDAAQVKRLLADAFAGNSLLPLFHPDLVLLECDARNKDEAIKMMVDALHAAGRTHAPVPIEQAVWDREATYSTSVGFGFAIPHCKCDTLTADSVVLARLRQPIDWGATDEPVEMAMLLAIRQSNQDNAHMKILAGLARKLINEEFRARLLGELDAQALTDYLITLFPLFPLASGERL